MVIKTDAEGKNVIEQLCDVALRAGGVQNLQAVTEVLKSIEVDSGPKP